MYLSAWLVGLALLVGVGFVLLFGEPRRRSFAIVFGLSIGIMIFVIFMDLLPSSYKLGNSATMIGGFLLGIVFMDVLERIVHKLPISPCHFTHVDQESLVKTGILVATGIGLHHIPEGIALAVGFHTHDHVGISLALAIGIHHIPEGVITALPLKLAGVSNRAIILTTLGIASLTPISVFLSQFLIGNSEYLVSTLLAVASGSMLYVVLHELVPQSLSKSKRCTVAATILGMSCMLAYSVLFAHSCINH